MVRVALSMFGALTALFTGSGGTATAQDFEAARRRMVETQLKAEGIGSSAVLQAMARVPRHLFVPPDLRDRAYENSPLPIGLGQTISQPFIVAYMTELLQVTRDHTVLEIGTGSGYQAAVLAELAREVLTIEIVPQLADRARDTLEEAGYSNVTVRTGNGYLGWPERAPFQRILVTAAPEAIPSPSSTSSPSAASWSCRSGRSSRKLSSSRRRATASPKNGPSRFDSCRWSKNPGNVTRSLLLVAALAVPGVLRARTTRCAFTASPSNCIDLARPATRCASRGHGGSRLCGATAGGCSTIPTDASRPGWRC